jgi:hypothetical protein
MRPFIAALYGGIVPLIAVSCAGLLAVRAMRFEPRRGEAWPLAVAIGSPLCALLYVILSFAGVARRGVFFGTAAVLLAATLRWRPKRTGDPVSRWPGLALALVLAIFGTIYLPAAAGPDTTPPPFDEAIAQVAAVVRAPRGTTPHDLAISLLLAPFVLGGHSAVAVFHLGFLFALALLCAAAAMRLANQWLPAVHAGWAYFAAGMLVFASPALAFAACDARAEIIGILALTAGLSLAALAVAGRKPAAAAASAVAFTLLLPAWTGASAFPGFLFLPLERAWAVIPLAAIAVAVLIARYRAILILITVFHLATSWPGIARLLAPPSLAILNTVTWQDATTKDRDGYLNTHLPGYIHARFLEESVLPNSNVATDIDIPRAWTTRKVTSLHAWDSIIQAAYDPAHRYDSVEVRRFSVLKGRHLPVPLTSPAAEVRLFRNGLEIARNPQWRVRCPEAFDNSLLTACQGKFAEIDFGAPVLVDEVRIHGKKGVSAGWPKGMRRAAMEELRRAGITHLLLEARPGLPGELSRNTRFWGVHKAGERAGTHLYALD